MPARPRICLLTLGEELLLGLTANGHLTFVGECLSRRGVCLSQNLVISDEDGDIRGYFRRCWEESDVVITTGGLGPTIDDRTRESIAAELGCPLEYVPEVMTAIEERFLRMGRVPTENNRRQAFKLQGSEILPNHHGTAPGLWLASGHKLLIMLPGPPNELQPMFVDQVLPRLTALGLLAGAESYLQLRTIGIGESALAQLLDPFFVKQSHLSVAYCAHQGQVDVRLSSPDQGLSRCGLHSIAEECRETLGEDFLCYGHDSLVQVVSDLLRRRDLNLAVAESCTGGLLSNSFTDLPGASKFFAGGVVCYSNNAKMSLLDVPDCILEQHGAVSAETAIAMATGSAERLGADYGLAVTGFAGPCGGNQENPVGTIYIGLHTPLGVWCRKLNYPGQRLAVKKRAVNAALDWLRRELLRADSLDPSCDPEARAEARRLLNLHR